MANRTRNIVLRVPVTPEERALIQQKMAQLHTKNFSAYARKMLIDGYIVHMDTSDIRAQTAELQKIGVNVNQIARRINSTGTVYAQDIEDIKGALAKIWQLQRYGSYKDTSYQVNAEKGAGLHREPGQDRGQNAGVLFWLFL